MSAAPCYLCLAPAAVDHRAAPLCEACNRALAVEHGLWLAAVPLDDWPDVLGGGGPTAGLATGPILRERVEVAQSRLAARWRNTSSAWAPWAPVRR